MTTLCPRCGTQRISDFCHICGLDFRTLTAPVQPASPVLPAPPIAPIAPAPQPQFQPQPQPQLQPEAQPQPVGYQAQPQPPIYQYAPPPAPPPTPAPTTCPRCYAPLYPGYPQCGNCGLDTGSLWGTPAAPRRSPILPIAIALLGVALLVVAAALFVIAQPKSGSSTASPSASAVAVASATPSPALVPTPPSSAKASSNASQPLPGGTTEPLPIDTWTTFASPDGKWTVAFPGTTVPTKNVLSSGTGTTATTETTFQVVDASGARYIADYTDFTAAFVASTGAPALLDLMQNSLERSTSGTAVAVTPSTELGYTARDVTLVASTMTMNVRMWVVGSRLYLLVVGATAGDDVYPQHFFVGFKLK